jgi:hypothetical protein
MPDEEQFELTHVIKYKEDGVLMREWRVQLLDRHTGAAITFNGEKCWSMNPNGRWVYSGPLHLKSWKEGGKVEVISCKVKAPRKIKKGQEPKHMPDGTVLQLTLRDDRWYGTCEADGKSVTGESAGLMGLGSKLCRTWLQQHGHANIKGKP